MATLLLTAVGTALGGPLGGAIGALAGRQIDGAIIGSPSREGPRLKELDVTTSSYGSPIPLRFGATRAGGTIIWATDLVESSEIEGGGKGRPSTTTYSYSSSFAVALSSRPIVGVGRIWADGNLLRGAAGDLKAGGTLRIHRGHADQLPDPLIASAQGAGSPAFRGTAYAVFEDLQLADFGNRIPALTFEIFAGQGDVALADVVGSVAPATRVDARLAGLRGFALEGAPMGQAVATLGQLYPLAIEASGDALALAQTEALDISPSIPLLPPEPVAAAGDDEFGGMRGAAFRRLPAERPHVAGVRHYDPARDYQPGIQRTVGQAGTGRPDIIEFPATLEATTAKTLAAKAARNGRVAGETVAWRMAEIDPEVRPGSLVRLPDRTGIYRVVEWEWRERAVELSLARHASDRGAGGTADPGRSSPPPDVVAGPTQLRAFGLAWDGNGNAASAQLFAAATIAGNGRAQLYSLTGNALDPLGQSVRGDALQGILAAPLASSPGLRFEAGAALEIELSGNADRLAPATLAQLGRGANRLWVAGEILQFTGVEPLGGGRWHLSGLLRGRAGTEAVALAGHDVGSPCVVLDSRLASLDPSLAETPQPAIAAIGLGDAEPVEAAIADPQASLRPLCPVHPRMHRGADGGLTLCWKRRARGAWTWRDGVDVPLVEESEAYRIGLGPLHAPHAEWNTAEPLLVLEASASAALASEHAGATFWVRQLGTHGASDPLAIGALTAGIV